VAVLQNWSKNTNICYRYSGRIIIETYGKRAVIAVNQQVFRFNLLVIFRKRSLISEFGKVGLEVFFQTLVSLTETNDSVGLFEDVN